METREDELEAFKSRIDLEHYAQGQDYETDGRSSSVTSRTLRHPDGDKIIIGMGLDGHFVFCSIRDHTDNGSIIDFVQNRRGFNLGQVRKELRPWLDRPTASPAAAPRIRAAVVDLPGVQASFVQTQPITGASWYLNDRRGIPVATYTHPKFAGRVYEDGRGNVILPHYNGKGNVCGYEVKNEGWTGFATGGMKGLFGSRKEDDDTALIICETGLDVLSYATLFGADRSRFLSTAGSMNPHQPALLRSAFSKLPPGARVISATDNDDGGDAIAEQVEAVFLALGRTDIGLERHSPETSGEDWNDALLASLANSEPLQRQATPPGETPAPGPG